MSSNINMLKTFVEGELIKAKDTNSNNQYLDNKMDLIKTELAKLIENVSSSLTPFTLNSCPYLNGVKNFLTIDTSQDESGNTTKVLHAHSPFTYTTGNRKTVNVTSDVYLDITSLSANVTYNIFCDYNEETQQTSLVVMTNNIYKSATQPDNMAVGDIWLNTQEPLSAYIKTLSSLQLTNKTLVGTYNNGEITNVEIESLTEQLINGFLSKDLSNLSSDGQAILDRKVEVEALLEPNGYAKFTWKDGNKISILLQWGLNSISTNTTVSLPTSFLNTNYTLLNSYDDLSTLLYPPKVTRQSKTSFVATANYGGNPVSNINIGWFAVGI